MLSVYYFHLFVEQFDFCHYFCFVVERLNFVSSPKMYSQNPDFDYDGEEEFYDNPLLTGGRRGTIFIVDIGKKMFERDEHNDYYIKKAMVQMRDYLNALALSGSMVERVCIIFINAVILKLC